MKRIDLASFLTLLITIGLFIVALFEKGLTHDLLLEAGVFLVSMKLVLASHKTDLANQSIQAKLDQLLQQRK